MHRHKYVLESSKFNEPSDRKLDGVFSSEIWKQFLYGFTVETYACRVGKCDKRKHVTVTGRTE